MTVSLELAISAIRSGRKDEGRQLLNLLIQQNPNDEKLWLWMSSVVDTDEQRARCLYHVLAIDPGNQLARKGLQLLGIVVSDSRPVKVPRDSQPIQIPKPTSPPLAPAATPASQPEAPAASSPPAERRPFLVAPEVVTREMPFTPIRSAQSEVVQASPHILSIDVESLEPQDDSEPKPQEAAAQPAQATSEQPGSSPEEARPQPDPSTQPEAVLSDQFAPAADTRYTETQKMVEPEWVRAQTSSAESSADPKGEKLESTAQPDVKPDEAQKEVNNPASQPTPETPTPAPSPPPSPGQSLPQSGMPKETRPSQPVPAMNPDNTPPNHYPYHSMPPSPANHSQVTMGMPNQYGQPPYPSNPMLPAHAQATMGMPFSGQPGQGGRPPSDPIPPIHASHTLGMQPQQFPALPAHAMGFHSDVTMMMPTMSEAEARARLATNYAIPATDAAAMALQNNAHQYNYNRKANVRNDIEDEDDDEINILAVIIFGTLSVTALGGFGMLILLVFTAPPV